MVETEALSDEVKKVQGAVETLNAALGYKRYRLAYIHKSQVDFAEKNARYMPSEMFRNLVENISKDAQLASVPLAWLHEDGRYKILSGNHRVQAAMEAGIEWFLVLYTDAKLSRSEEVAIQLSHNAIEGKDDPIILKDLWREIEDVSLKGYSGLDDKALEELPAITLASLKNVNLDYRQISILFLPAEEEMLKQAFEQATGHAKGNTLYLAREADFDRLLDGLSQTRAAYDIKNTALAIMLILDLYGRHLTDLAEGWAEEDEESTRLIPLASIFGTDKVPVGLGHLLKRVLGKMKDRKLIDDTNLVKAIAIMAEEYVKPSKET
jgi:hypothetical protein